MNKEFRLGVELEDMVSGLKGICVGKLEYLNGCVQYCIKSKVGEDNKVPEGEWIDSQQLVQTGEGIKVESSVTGGYSKDAPKL